MNVNELPLGQQVKRKNSAPQELVQVCKNCKDKLITNHASCSVWPLTNVLKRLQMYQSSEPAVTLILQETSCLNRFPDLPDKAFLLL